MYLIKKFRQVISSAASTESGGDLTLMLGQIEKRAVSYNDIKKLAQALEVLDKIRRGSNANSLSMRIKDAENYGDSLIISFESVVEGNDEEICIVSNDQMINEDNLFKNKYKDVFLDFLNNIRALVHKTLDIFYGSNTEEGS